MADAASPPELTRRPPRLLRFGIPFSAQDEPSLGALAPYSPRHAALSRPAAPSPAAPLRPGVARWLVRSPGEPSLDHHKIIAEQRSSLRGFGCQSLRSPHWSLRPATPPAFHFVRNVSPALAPPPQPSWRIRAMMSERVLRRAVSFCVRRRGVVVATVRPVRGGHRRVQPCAAAGTFPISERPELFIELRMHRHPAASAALHRISCQTRGYRGIGVAREHALHRVGLVCAGDEEHEVAAPRASAASLSRGRRTARAGRGPLVTRRSRSASCGEPGKSEATCASGPRPSSFRSSWTPSSASSYSRAAGSGSSSPRMRCTSGALEGSSSVRWASRKFERSSSGGTQRSSPHQTARAPVRLERRRPLVRLAEASGRR